MTKKKISYNLIILIFLILVLGAFFILMQPAKQEKDTTPSAAEEAKVLPDGAKYIVDPKEILTLLAADRIPSIDFPEFESAQKADEWLTDEDLVVGLNYNNIRKAYPLRILNWHEIVNDPDVGGKPVLITYCPLCRTGIAFEPFIGNERVEFGTSGKLWNSDLVMYDRKTKSLWSQVLGQAIAGELSGSELKMIFVDIARWKDWKAKYPGTLVLSREVQCSKYNSDCKRDYSYNPYGSEAESPIIGLSTTDARLSKKAIVYGVDINNRQKAYPHDKIKELKAVNDVVGNVSIAAVWDADLNTVKIFRSLSEFSFADGKFIDSNGREWTINDMEKNLGRVETFGHFWFAWAAFFPDTELLK